MAWYDENHRHLPWRAEVGEVADPYAVWLSEIMLQQTGVLTVKNYFDNFLSRWPRVSDLAAANLDDVLHAWQGLGYYARARNLHKCAKVITSKFDGNFPEWMQESEEEQDGDTTKTAKEKEWNKLLQHEKKGYFARSRYQWLATEFNENKNNDHCSNYIH